MQVTGVIQVVVGGTVMDAMNDANIEFGMADAEDVVGTQPLGYRVKPTAPGVSFALAHSATLSIAWLKAQRNTTVQLLCDTGVSYILRGAYCKTAKGPKAGSGEVSCEFGAMSVQEMRA